MSPFRLVFRLADAAESRELRNLPNDGWAKAYAVQDLRLRLSIAGVVEGSVSVGQVADPDRPDIVEWMGTWRLAGQGEAAWIPYERGRAGRPGQSQWRAA